MSTAIIVRWPDPSHITIIDHTNTPMSFLHPPGSDHPLSSILVRWIDSDNSREQSSEVESERLRFTATSDAMAPFDTVNGRRIQLGSAIVQGRMHATTCDPAGSADLSSIMKSLIFFVACSLQLQYMFSSKSPLDC